MKRAITLITLVVITLALATPITAHAQITDPTTNYWGDLKALDILPNGTVIIEITPPQDRTVYSWYLEYLLLLVDIDNDITTGTLLEVYALDDSITTLFGIDAIIWFYLRPVAPVITVVLYGSNGEIIFSGRYILVPDFEILVLKNMIYNNGIYTLILNWTELAVKYTEITGVQVNESTLYVVTNIYGVKPLKVAYDPTPTGTSAQVYDQLNGAIYTLPSMVNVVVDGDLSDWPSDSLAIHDDPESEIEYLPHIAGEKVYLGANDTHLFVGLEYEIIEDPSGDMILSSYAGFVIIVYDVNDLNNLIDFITIKVDHKNQYVWVYRYEGWEIEIPPDPYSYVISSSVDNKVFVELAMSLSELDPIAAGTTYLIDGSSWYFVSDYLGVEGPAVVHAYQVDYEAGEVEVVYVGVYSVAEAADGENSISMEGAVLEFNTTAQVYVMYGAVETPPFADPPATELEPIGFYYFAFDNPGAVEWPVRLVIDIGSGFNPASVTVFYYNKSVDAYVELPPEAVTISGSTVVVTIDEEMYYAGDPAVLVYGMPSTVGGVLDTGGGGWGLFVLFAGFAALVAGVVVRRIF